MTTTLTPEQMRELADALNRIARSHAMIAPEESEAQYRAADCLRQCAEDRSCEVYAVTRRLVDRAALAAKEQPT